MQATRRRHEGATNHSVRQRRGALWVGLLALPLVACTAEQATPRPEEAAGGLSSLIRDAELKDPFAAKPGAKGRDATPRTPSADLKDPFAGVEGVKGVKGAGAPEGASAELKDPFRDAAPPPPSSDDSEETAAAGLKDPFRAEPASDANSPHDAGLKDPYTGKDEPAAAAGLKDPFRAP